MRPFLTGNLLFTDSRIKEPYTMFETAMFLEAFEKLCTVQHQRMKDKGFWNPDPATGGSPDNVSIPTKLLLIVSEATEMFEAYRKGALTAPCDKDATVLGYSERTCNHCDGAGSNPNREAEEVICPICLGEKKIRDDHMRRLTNEEEELADIVIRLADYCGWRGIDLGRVILAKMEYNTKRPHMHGKTC